MPDRFRQPLGATVMFWGGFVLWLLFGLQGLGVALLGASLMWCIVGIGSGYWMGVDAAADHMVLGAMARLRELKAHSARLD